MLLVAKEENKENKTSKSLSNEAEEEVKLGDWSPQPLCWPWSSSHSTIFVCRLNPELSGGKRVLFFPLISFDCQWFFGEMTSQLLLGLHWLGVVYLNLNLAPGVSSACSDGTEDLGIKLIPGGREMIYYLLISVNLLTWRNWGLRLSHQNISVLSCSSIKMSSTFQWKPWELKVLVACLRASEASIGILIDFPGSYIELICQNPLS